METALQLSHITKIFGKIAANDDISLTVKKGSIHCILGENGCGKTTLMNVISGLYKPEEGEVFVNGEKARIDNPKDAMKYRIGMVHQHFMLFNQNTVLENIIVGEEKCGMLLKTGEQRKFLQQIIDQYQFHVNLDDRIRDLSVGTKQKVEILKVLYRGADLIIFDEPTAVLTPQEADHLMDIILGLKKDGKTILFISHKLNETLKIGDQITVLRRGKVVYETENRNSTPEKLAYEMVGKETRFGGFERKEYKPGETILKITGAQLKEGKQPVSLEVHAGEVLGIAGVDGNGQQELEQLIVGILKQKNCFLEFLGQDMSQSSVLERKMAGVAYIPSDRLEYAVMEEQTLTFNYLLGNHSREEFQSHGLIRNKKLSEYTEDCIEKYDVRTSGAMERIRNLSGGNQQKIVLSREISQEPRLILAGQPTRGLDIGAIEFVHTTLLRERDKGNAIILISAELSEITELSDKILVLYDGEVMAEDVSSAFTRESLGLLMAGKRSENSAAAQTGSKEDAAK